MPNVNLLAFSKSEIYSQGQIRVDTLIFYYILSINPYSLQVDKSMGKKFRRLHLHKIAFNLVPQQLFCTKAKNIRESRKRNMILKCLCPHVGCVESQWFTS